MGNIGKLKGDANSGAVGQRMEVASVIVLVAGLLCLVPGAYFMVDSRRAEKTCLQNLHSIGAATALYCEDFDGFYPAAYTSVRWPQWSSTNWSWNLEPYLHAGASAEIGKNNTYRTDGRQKGVVSQGWADAGGSLWHCPADRTGTNVSYGLNPFVAGAGEYQEEFIRVDSWRPSMRQSDVPSPATVLLAGDTTKQWHEDVGKYYEVYGDWMRDRDLPMKDGRVMDAPEMRAWYRDFLTEDITDIRGECPRPGGWGCKGPAYWHDRKGQGTGAAGMLFCDGHVRAMRFGSIKVENVIPDDLGSNSLGANP